MAANGKERKLSALDRVILSAIGDDRSVGRADDPARELYPQLWEWLTKTGFQGDYVMQPGSLSLTLGPEGVFVTVTNRDCKASISCSCSHLSEVFAALEAALTSPNPPVKLWGKGNPSVRKRKSKN